MTISNTTHDLYNNIEIYIKTHSLSLKEFSKILDINYSTFYRFYKTKSDNDKLTPKNQILYSKINDFLLVYSNKKIEIAGEINTNKDTSVSYNSNKFDNTTSSSFSVFDLIENNSSKSNIEFFQNKIIMNTIVENKENITENKEILNGKKKRLRKHYFYNKLNFHKEYYYVKSSILK